MTISSIRTRDFQRDDFTSEELDAMRQDGDTAALLNKVRHDVGIKGADVGVRGDDKGNAELRKEWQDHDVVHTFGATPVDCAIEGLEGTAPHLLGLVKFGYDAVSGLIDAEERGEALKVNNERGAMHLGMIAALDLPQGYKNVEVAKWKESGTANASGAVRMGTHLEAIDRRDAAILQLHADRDSTAADIASVVACDPQLKAKYDSDAAFRAGFDGLVWAKTHDTPAYDAAVTGLHARDARYDQHAIVRG